MCTENFRKTGNRKNEQNRSHRQQREKRKQTTTPHKFRPTDSDPKDKNKTNRRFDSFSDLFFPLPEESTNNNVLYTHRDFVVGFTISSKSVGVPTIATNDKRTSETLQKYIVIEKSRFSRVQWRFGRTANRRVILKSVLTILVTMTATRETLSKTIFAETR